MGIVSRHRERAERPGHPVPGPGALPVLAVPLLLLLGPVMAGAQPVGMQPAGSPGLDVVGVVIRWLFYLSIVGAVGTVAFRLLVIPQLAPDPEFAGAVDGAIRRSWVLAWVAAGLGVLVLPTRLWDHSVRLFGGGALDASNLTGLVFQSAWGAGWLFQAGLFMLFIAGAVGARPAGRTRRGWLVMALAALGLTVVPALSGHAWEVGAGRRWAVLNDSLHVLGAGAWVGGLGTLLLAGLPAARRTRGEGGKKRRPFLAGLVDGYSRLAIGAITLVLGAGIINAWIHLDAIGQLVTTGYGRTLLLKLGLVAGALALAFYTQRNVRPSLAESPRAGLIRIPAFLELLLALGALAVVAALVALQLPG